MKITIKHEDDNVIIRRDDFENVLQMMTETGFEIKTRSIEPIQKSVHWVVYLVIGLAVFVAGMNFGFWLAGI